jgi:putative transcriptional regulator
MRQQFPSELMAIKWRLAAVMADRELDYRQLADKTGLHPVTISKLKNTYVMPRRLDSETLEKLCSALNCQPADLMKYQPDKEVEES